MKKIITILIITGCTHWAFANDALRVVDEGHVTEKQQMDAVLSRLLTWTTGGARENDYISVGRLANFFGFVKLRVSSDHTLTRAAVGQATWMILDDQQQKQLLELLENQQTPFQQTIQHRVAVNRLLESLQRADNISFDEFSQVYLQYALAEAELGRVIAQALGTIVKSLDNAQIERLSQLRHQFISGTFEKNKAEKVKGEKGNPLPNLSKSDQQELLNLTSRLLAWQTGLPDDNDFETVGKPSQHFGFVSLRVDSNHAVKRGDVAKKVNDLLNTEQKGWIVFAVQQDFSDFQRFLSYRAQLLRYYESAQVGAVLDPVIVSELAKPVSLVEATMTYNQAMTMLKVVRSMDATQLSQLVELKDSYIILDADQNGEEQSSELASQWQRGQQLFAQCVICHQNTQVAPDLFGVTNRLIATDPEFKHYSPAMQAFAQEQSTWNEALFLDFVQSPKGVVSGTSMAFKGVATESDAQALWKYLLASETLED